MSLLPYLGRLAHAACAVPSSKSRKGLLELGQVVAVFLEERQLFYSKLMTASVIETIQEV